MQTLLLTIQKITNFPKELLVDGSCAVISVPLSASSMLLLSLLVVFLGISLFFISLLIY